jgi:hypothetical protein
MSKSIRAIRYRNLDEARQALKEAIGTSRDIFDDGGEEPQGLLSVIPEDRLPDEEFVKLLDVKKGVLIDLERLSYSGFGPPAEEQAYMGFVNEKTAYVLVGRRLPIEIDNCSFGARDLHHLEALVLDQVHPINREDLADRLKLGDEWDFDNLFDLIVEGGYSATEIDRLIHKGIQ